MTVLHRIKIPADRVTPSVSSPLGKWECCAGEQHSFYEPMVQATFEIDADHTLHLFCEADQVDAAVEALRRVLVGQP